MSMTTTTTQRPATTNRTATTHRAATTTTQGPAGGSVVAPGAPGQALTSAARRAAEAGMATAEYAVATLAAVGFAGLLIAILKSDEVRGMLLGIVRSALAVG